MVRSEGELTFLELVNGVKVSDIKGLSYKINGKIINNPGRPLIKELDSLPFPGRDLFLNETNNTDYGNVITGRGCPYSCSYCASKKIWDKKVRFRSPDNIINELIYLKKNFNSSLIYFVDDKYDTYIAKQNLFLAALLPFVRFYKPIAKARLRHHFTAFPLEILAKNMLYKFLGNT